MTDSLAFWLVALPAVFITGVSKSGFAGGIGIITVPLMALVISPIKAAAIMLPLLIFMDILSVRIWWGKQNKRHLKYLLSGAIVGISLGYITFGYLDESWLRLILGLSALCFSGWGLFFGSSLSISTPPLLGRIAGMVSGFTSFLAHAGGPPLNFYLIPLKLKREVFLATAVVFLAAINLLKFFPYMLLGQINTENVLTGIALAPIAWLGVKYGIKIQSYCNDQVFYKIILTVLGVVGIKLILDGIQ